MARKWTPEMEAAATAKQKAACIKDPHVWAESIWKDNKGRRIKNGEIHKRIYRALEKARLARTPILILAPMGVGKTEIGMAFLTRILDLEPQFRVGVVGDMTPHSAQRVTAMARYIEYDPDHNRLFPDVKIGRGKWTAETFRLEANTYAKDESCEGAGVMASGTGSRKDVIFFDDCVTEKNAILQPADKVRVKHGFKGTWLSRLEPDTGWWFYIGTLYAADDLSHDLLENKHFAHLRFSVNETFDGYDLEEYWPGEDGEEGTTTHSTCELFAPKWDKQAYLDKYHAMISGGEATKWYTGYRNMVIDPSTAAFQKSPGFMRTIPHPEWERWRHIVMYADPASSQDEKADYYAGVVLGWDPKRKGAVVLHKWKVREPLGDRVKRYLDVWQAFTPITDGVEGKHELSFREELRRTAAELGIPIQARAINHGPDAEKIARISSIAPLVETGKILFDGVTHPEFWDEAQLFPRGKNDDLLDALEGAWVLMRKRLWRNRQVPGTFDPDAPFDGDDPRARLAKYRIPLREPSDPYNTGRSNKSPRDLLWE